jgi:hypothetical protein
MDNFRADAPGRGVKSESVAGDTASAPDVVSFAASPHARDGDVIRGLRSGLIFSIAIWAMLFTVGSLVFG